VFGKTEESENGAERNHSAGFQKRNRVGSLEGRKVLKEEKVPDCETASSGGGGRVIAVPSKVRARGGAQGMLQRQGRKISDEGNGQGEGHERTKDGTYALYSRARRRLGGKKDRGPGPVKRFSPESLEK